MSTLSDKDIWNLIEKEELCISPLTPDNIQPGSIDLTLGSTIDVFDAGKVDVNISKEDLKLRTKSVDITGGFDLNPGQFVTGHSAELIKMPNYLNGLILNRNSFARIGLHAEISQYINPGYEGNKIIVLSNISNSTFPHSKFNKTLIHS